MKSVAILCVLAVVVAAVSSARIAREDKYTTKYDNVNLDEILGNERIFNKYYVCILDGTDCTPDGTTLREAIPDALTNDCSKCNDKQKEGTEKVIRHLYQKKQEQWKELAAKYDPEGVYQKKHADKLKTLNN